LVQHDSHQFQQQVVDPGGAMNEAFAKEMKEGYGIAEPALILGSAILGEEVLDRPHVAVALSVLNRHGLVAGATGTGKTKTLQSLAGQLSDEGVPVFVADVKGDLTGLAAPGEAANPKIQERCQQLNWEFKPSAHPVQFLSLSGELGAPIRATVHSFGPLLLAKVLDLNETQTSILSLVFKYCDDNQLPLLDLADLRTTLQFLSSDDGKAALKDYGGISPASVGVLLRAIVTLEQEGADKFFGEPEFEVQDLLSIDPSGKGTVSVLELSDVLDSPKLFSTFMLWLLAQLWHVLPEIGDPPKPKLVFFFDEAHLLFDEASKTLLDEIEQTVRLIRSKGVGIYFVTQVPADVPNAVLAQLGNRVQHALRAFTPDDADALKKTVRTFPRTSFYDVEKLLTSLGIGEAAVTVLSPKGVPTPLAGTRLLPPDSLMSAIDPAQLQQLRAANQLQAKYGTPIDRESAHEIITARIQAAQQQTLAEVTSTQPTVDAKAQARAEREAERTARAAERERAARDRANRRMFETAARTGGRLATSRAGQDLIRGVLGTLFGGRR
jgi:DNA helicase HerA-like ATPase